MMRILLGEFWADSNRGEADSVKLAALVAHTWCHWRKASPLLPSGLLGPVMLRPPVVRPITATGHCST